MLKAQSGVEAMPEELTDSETALLCDIGEYDIAKATDAQKRDLERLVSGGYVTPAQGRTAFMPTAKGVAYLGERGAGLNEA
jgi:hypothetical protein